jgi:hypothetical protein
MANMKTEEVKSGNKTRVFLLAAVYCAISIASKLYLFYGFQYDTPAGRLVPLVVIGLLLPFVIFTVYLKRKENGGLIGGKEAVRQGLMFVSIVAVISLIFDYIFFVAELKDFYREFFANTDYHVLLKEKLKHQKNVTMLEIVKQQLLYKESFMSFSISRAIFPIFAFGLFSSFISGVFMKRA